MLPGVRSLIPARKLDHRGWFSEVFNQKTFHEQTGLDIAWVQDCRFLSKKGALRGPHFYPIRYGQYKLVECLSGAAFDVAICVDSTSEFYGDYHAVQLLGGSGCQFLVPPGHAHAVLALEDSVVQYKTNVFNLAQEQTALAWDDPDVAIDWPITPYLFSEEATKLFKDLVHP